MHSPVTGKLKCKIPTHLLNIDVEFSMCHVAFVGEVGLLTRQFMDRLTLHFSVETNRAPFSFHQVLRTDDPSPYTQVAKKQFHPEKNY